MPRQKKTQPTAASEKIVVPVKRLSDKAVLPTKAHDTDACFDLYCTKAVRLAAGGTDLIPTGIAVNIPPGYFGKVYERSGLSSQRPITIKAGVIDAGYTGEIKLVVHNHGDYPEMIDAGTKLAQIAIHELPVVELVEVDDLESTKRGSKGFGSSGS